MNDQYLKYDTLELAQDDAFIQWVKEGGSSSQQWEEWLARHPEKQPAVEEARQLVLSIVIREASVEPGRLGEIWKKIDAATADKAAQPAAPRIRAYRWIGYATAAVLALLLAFFFLRPDGTITVETGYGQLAEHILPDGSKVALNAGSSISYHKDTWAETRRINLEGEAFFEVEKGSPFIVQASEGTVEVLGTSFNVYTFQNRFDVRCYTGRVQVSAEGKETILTAGQLAQWSENQWQRDRFDPKNSLDWQEGRFEYHNTQLREVFAEMERQFDIRIEAPDSVLARNYTGMYERNSLDSALYRVCWPMQLKSSRKGEVVIIR